jgi:ATP-dependent RNA helicase DHX33
MTILNICRSYDLLSTTSNTNTKKAKKEWCKKYFINHRTLLEASKIHQQLISISSKIGLNPELSSLREGQQEEEDRIITSLAYGLVANSAFLQKDGTYKQTMGHSVRLPPSPSPSRSSPRLINS